MHSSERKIKDDPNDQWIILSAWNPATVLLVALPPCHMMCQFYVHLPVTPDAPKCISCLMYQRSADLGLGIPFNIASYALLTHMSREPYAHVYRDHVEALETQLKREPMLLPKVKFRREIHDIDGFDSEDIVVEEYDPYLTIPMKMSV
ncbi:hypothetical protein AZE42_08947 [Rhizopogon vesiculosus]|uniref:thymidylate synthase n=1 Tax=Rhizopogon vesiculosus TaxID=180088 RepID=A0A1J8QX59_9AGAM|nr:hypothetical protein AZE42_08947 [Rhizopogon vesiculosus]